MKKLLTLFIFFNYLGIRAQVGIGNINPKANLDIRASNLQNPKNTDGILIPRIDNFPNINPTAAQNGMLVFVTGNGTPTKGFYYWNQSNTSWISITANTPKHYIGELFKGGIIFYIYANGQHGLIASLHDLNDNNGAAWSGITDTEIGTTAQSIYNGRNNTNAIILQNNTPNKAATLCDSYSYGGFYDWYLPSKSELELLASQYFLINKILENDGDPTTKNLSAKFIYPSYGRYWSSTENNSVVAWCYDLHHGQLKFYNKSLVCNIRAIRSF